MISSIKVKNFKSIVDISFEPGYFNVIIGENGCGKSNILEAIAFAAASEARKCDYEFLGNRGIRVSNPSLMVSAFNNPQESIIKIDIMENKEKHYFELFSDPKDPKKWLEKHEENILRSANRIIEARQTTIKKIEKILSDPAKRNKSKDAEKLLFDFNKLNDEVTDFITNFRKDQNYELSNFMIFSAEHSVLRSFMESRHTHPIGNKGEGMFQYLRELSSQNMNASILNEIRENLELLDWYEGFEIPEDLLSNESTLFIRDRFFIDTINYFDQRSTNEGFLFILFYTLLIVSKDTPKFFAIDNIDNSLNPKLCVRMIKNLSALAKKHGKQIVVTTHNPAVLDGLDLADDGQRLFVVRRNEDGHTKIKRVPYRKNSDKMSSVWTKGLIGGLPDNF